MNSTVRSKQFTIIPYNNQRIAQLCGPLNEHISQIEKFYGVTIFIRGNTFNISGNPQSVQRVSQLLNRLYSETLKQGNLTPAKINLFIKDYSEEPSMITPSKHEHDTSLTIKTQKIKIIPRGEHQESYVKNVKEKDINFAIGPAGTGKTYLAVACALEALEKGYVKRLVFVRPAVEAGERLGFLPGGLEEKVMPYLRPLYDALYDMIGFDGVEKLVQRNIIEIAPLAFMRGRTLNDAFIILDEAQNTTEEQMKMFLTRMGFGSTVVITGDITQIDLARGITSGLKHAITVLKNVEGVSFNYFDSQDTVRHPLVKSIIQAYERQHSK